MPLNSDIIISDTSCLILLTNIDELSLLKKMSKVVLITPEIATEFGEKLPSWIKIRETKDKQFQKLLEREIDQGEASAIILAIENPNSILLIDDLKGRNIANQLDLNYSGTFGLILRSKQLGIIERVRPIIEKVQNTNFRYSTKLLNQIIEEAGE